MVMKDRITPKQRIESILRDRALERMISKSLSKFFKPQQGEQKKC
jgi:hypothetical protein